MDSPAALTNSERLWSSIMQIAQIGAIADGGSCRLALSDEDKQARDLFVTWCRQAGCTIRTDSFGNIFAIRAGSQPDLPAILVGSHLDTQPHGGRFDGVVGVMAGLEIIRSLNDANIATQAPVVVVNWTNEEGVRFKPGLTGSCGFVGSIAAGDASAISSQDGSNYFAELQRIGYAGQDQPPAIAAYFEMHIEQGPVLEAASTTIGVVTGVQGVRWYEILIEGQDAHAGTTPMQGRSDSFMAAAAYVHAVRNAGLEVSPDIRVTFGQVEVQPNSTNTVPGLTRLTLDLRHADEPVLDQVEGLLQIHCEQLRNEGCSGTISRIMNVRPVLFDPALIASLADAASMLAVQSVRLPSGAMHDASNMAIRVPSAMLFIPSRQGISHNPREWSEPAHIADGCEVLFRAVVQKAGLSPGRQESKRP